MLQRIQDFIYDFIPELTYMIVFSALDIYCVVRFWVDPFLCLMGIVGSTTLVATALISLIVHIKKRRRNA